MGGPRYGSRGACSRGKSSGTTALKAGSPAVHDGVPGSASRTETHRFPPITVDEAVQRVKTYQLNQQALAPSCRGSTFIYVSRDS